MKMLNELFENAPAIEIKKLSQDSRDISEGTMFFCIKGQRNDGHAYVDEVIEKGATVIVHSDDIEKNHDVCYIKVEDTMRALNEVCDKFYDSPSAKLKMIGVTGTNGKSTTSSLIYQLLNKLGNKSGYIGTIEVAYAGMTSHTNYTTPETIELQSILNDMVNNGCESCAMEVSSFGLDFHRVDGVHFNSAVYTNLSHEHLDVHGNMDNYAAAKAKLFEMLSDEGTAIINLDDEYADFMKERVHSNLVTYSIKNPSATYYAKDIELLNTGTKFVLVIENQEYPVVTNLFADYNVSNLLAAIAAVRSVSDYDLVDIINNCEKFDQVKGRMEVIDLGQPFKVIVDYAHTPDSFMKIFPFAKSITPAGSKIISVFGSAGKRDAKKRPIMGEIADKYSDLIILTEDDYRNEDPKDIADEIKQGIKEHRCVFVSQRQTAIYQAINMAGENDTILILGKGEDAYMAIGDKREMYPGDHILARKLLKEFLDEVEIS